MKRSPERRVRAPSEDERALFARVMADVRPLRGRRRMIPSPQASPGPAPASAEVARAPGPPAPAKPERGELRIDAPPAAAGIDRATLTRLKRGEIAIDRRIDLHGMTQARAHETLDRFVADAAAHGARLLLIITGKGVGGDGVLRRMLPRWIAAGSHAMRVLRIEPAQPKHGGAGAWYVYLRKKREP
jgi:DNA-nicking Smr family endonuclease